MTAIRQDITIEQGADYDTPFFLRDDGGNPDDLTGRSYVMQVRTSFDAPYALLTLTTDDSSLAVEVSAGLVRPLIPYDATAGMAAGGYVYDLKERTPSGRVRRRRQGAATVTQQVTTAAPPDPTSTPYADARGNAYTDAQGNAYTLTPPPPPPPAAYTDAAGGAYTTASNDPYTP